MPNLYFKDYQPQAAMSQRGLSPYTPRMPAVNSSQSSSTQQHPAAPHLAELASNYDKKRKEQQNQQQQRRFAAHRAQQQQQQQHGPSKRSSALLADQQQQHARERRQPEVKKFGNMTFVFYNTLIKQKCLLGTIFVSVKMLQYSPPLPSFFDSEWHLHCIPILIK